jgi:hypothetical protein
VAELAKKMGKTVIAVAVMPEPSENRTERAVAGLKRLRALVPTVAISNAYLAEYLDGLPEDQADRITDREAWNIVDEHSTLPLIEILRAIFQTPGDLVNTDEADWESMLECGSHLGFGLVSVTDREEALKLGPENIVDELFKGRFQDTKIFERAKVAALWRQGEWPKRLGTKVEELVRAHVSKGATHDKPVEIHRGIASGAQDEKMWIAIIVVADEEGAESQASAALQPAAAVKVPFSFVSDGEMFHTTAPTDLVDHSWTTSTRKSAGSMPAVASTTRSSTKSKRSLVVDRISRTSIPRRRSRSMRHLIR